MNEMNDMENDNIPNENNNNPGTQTSQRPTSRPTDRSAAENPEDFIHRTLSFHEPNQERLDEELHTLERSYTTVLSRTKTTEEYLAISKELIDSLKTNFGSMFLKDLDESYTKNIRGELAKNDLAVLLKTHEANDTERLYLETVRSKILGNKTPSIEQYRNVLNIYAKVNQIIKTHKPSANDRTNTSAYTEACGAVALVQTILTQKGFDSLLLDGLKPDTEQIDAYAKMMNEHILVETMLKWVDENPIDPEILTHSKEKIDIIFGRSEKNEIDPELVKAYEYIHSSQEIVLDIDKAAAEEAKMYLEGSQLNLINMRHFFSYRKTLLEQYDIFLKYDPANINLPKLKDSINNITDYIISKKISVEKVDLLTKLAPKDLEIANPEFDLQASLILAPLEVNKIANVDIKDAINTFYTELAEKFDAANNKYGLELNTDLFASAAKTLKKMFDYQNALYTTKKSDYEEITRHVAKVQKFLEIKGFTKAEIEKIKSPDIYLEDSQGVDGFQKLANRHWDMYADKDIVILDDNKKPVEKTDENNIVKETNRQQIEVIYEETNNNVNIDDVDLFDETKKYIMDNNLAAEREQNNNEAELEEEFDYDIVK